MEYAHALNNYGQRQELAAHLANVAELAAAMADDFGAAEAARYLGLWHDVGKFHPIYQRYLQVGELRPPRRARVNDHREAGAKLARQYGSLLPILIQGHHGGLTSPTAHRAWLHRLSGDSSADECIARGCQLIPDLIPEGKLPFPAYVLREEATFGLFHRLLFSALVDADFLDAERHFHPEDPAESKMAITMEELWQRFNADQRRLMDAAPRTAINAARQEIYQTCLEGADRPPGVYRLTIPTGGGKTRSAMGFALRHALRHGHHRILYVAPYTTVTDEVSDLYWGIFGRDAHGRSVVIEHHSAVESAAADVDDDAHYSQMWPRLAAENWDAPIVVTNAVQLFESIFSNHCNRVRKIHRLAQSVIIIEEAQSIPGEVLTPVLDVLQELCAHYGATVVLCTAAPSSFDAIPPFAAIEAPEIVPDAARYLKALHKVEYDWRIDEALTWEEVADLVRGEPQALVVVNTKAHAARLLRTLGDPAALHLSTLICGAHRRNVIAEARRRLANGEPCQLISTQIVQAGIDLDFPLVLRALGPLGNVVQAAGRCNREGRLDKGRVIVFRPIARQLPPGFYREATSITAALSVLHDLDLDSVDSVHAFFSRLYRLMDTDLERVREARAAFDFPEVARRFKLPGEQTTSVVVLYGPAEERGHVLDLLAGLRTGGANHRLALRDLQPYMVQLRTEQVERLRRRGQLSMVMHGLAQWLGTYDERLGLIGVDPEADGIII